MTARVSLGPVPTPPVTLRLVAPPAAVQEPLWIATTFAAAKHKITSYLRTAWAFGTRPQATARAWSERRFEALNPLAYLLNSLAIIGPWRALWQRILGLPDVPFTRDLLAAMAPFLAILMAGSLHHLLFRLLGSKRHIQSSWAISIYATGGLPTLVGLLATPFALRLQHLATVPALRQHWHEVVLVQVLGLVTVVVQNAALAGLYRTTRLRALGVQVGSSLLGAFSIAIIGGQMMLVGTLLNAIAAHL